MYMLEDAAGAGSGNNPQPAPQGQPAAGEKFNVPEKFQGKSVEDVAKAYVELEKKFGETSGRVKDYESYTKLGKPDEVQQAIEWARGVYQRLTKGELIEASKAPKAPASPAAAPSGLPWEASDWELQPAAAQAKAIADYVRSANEKSIADKASEFAGQFGQVRQLLSNEQGLLLDAINEAIASGGKVTVKDILTNAAALGTKSPQELMKMALEGLTSQGKAEAEIERRVNERLAEAEQKRQNEQLALVSETTSPRPRFVSKKGTREETNKSIIEKLRKQGINLLQ